MYYALLPLAPQAHFCVWCINDQHTTQWSCLPGNTATLLQPSIKPLYQSVHASSETAVSENNPAPSLHVRLSLSTTIYTRQAETPGPLVRSCTCRETLPGPLDWTRAKEDELVLNLDFYTISIRPRHYLVPRQPENCTSTRATSCCGALQASCGKRRHRNCFQTRPMQAFPKK